MRKTVAAVIFNLVVSCVYGQTMYWQQRVNFFIDVSLNDVDHTLDGYVKMDYQNNSPDTLRFIWIHCWPNAYKNDLNAFSDQRLRNGKTDFYFSDADQRGYINRLSFKVNGTVVLMENHPEHQDIIKLLLPQPLAPHTSCNIETLFHVKLPYNFSRGGHKGQSYQITQWYPKPAVYDSKGWHPMPYLDQGEFYSEFGDYKVKITLPQNYTVVSTGVRQSATVQLAESISSVPAKSSRNVVRKKLTITQKSKEDEAAIPSSKTLQTLVYAQHDVHDFAWFADKRYTAVEDTLALQSGRIITAAVFHLNNKENTAWTNAMQFLKKAVLARSRLLGEYPYDAVSVAEGDIDYAGGMEYPAIAIISGVKNAAQLEDIIEHEVGHNWFYGILASNEREHPWMDEGMNTYYSARLWNKLQENTTETGQPEFINSRMPVNLGAYALQNQVALKRDQPIATAAEALSGSNYVGSAYYKPAIWMMLLEAKLGVALFDSAMRQYYNLWKFKHPYPEDFKQVLETVSGQNLDREFGLLNAKGNLPGMSQQRKLKLSSFFSLKDTDKYKYVFVAPAAGYNFYDKLMIGAVVHNYTLPAEKFQFLAAPLYSTASKSLNGTGRVSYTAMPGANGQQLTFSLAASKFTADEFTDSTTAKNYLGFSKIVPSIKYVFANKNPMSQVVKYLQWKTFFIAEKGLLFTRDTMRQADDISYPTTSRYVNQLQFSIANNRVLYPYKAQLVLDQGKDFARLAFTGNYFFNYAKGGGLQARFFAGKFFYPGGRTTLKQARTDAYQLNMTGPKGYEDYTYSNYFAGRSEFEGLLSQQIMERDGFFKVRTDFLSSKIGKSDNWLSAVNFSSTIPGNINPLKMLPIDIPLKVFVDVGTYAEAWKKNSNQGKFIFDAGLQLSLFKNGLNIYIPILYSRVYSDYFKSTITENRFLKNISFSIDIQNISLKKFFPQLAY